MPANSKMQNKALEGMKAAKTKSGKAALTSKVAAKTKTPLAGMAISTMLKMNRLKPKK